MTIMYHNVLTMSTMVTLCKQHRSIEKLRKSLIERIASLHSLAGYSLNADHCNVTPTIASKVGANLHRRPWHPLGILQDQIVDSFHQFQLYNDLSPIVSTVDNFDALGFPEDHVSRSASDTYYLDRETVLRTHTSVHQIQLLREHDQFLVAGDVYRRDEIDRSHYPVFHQMEGVKLYDASTSENVIVQDLKEGLESLAMKLFGSSIDMKWEESYFPFTNPSFELEIRFENEWLEVLGCGVIHPEILKRAGRTDYKGYAFGLGLERWAMILFQIPDIRLFWTQDTRFHDQFADGGIVKFQPYSKYPPCYKDMSFWVPEEGFAANDLNEVVRDVAGDLVEEVRLLDEFTNPKTGKSSLCYRIVYRSMDRSLTNAEIDELQSNVRQKSEQNLNIELR